MSIGILYYSENKLDGTKLNNACRETILASRLPITSVTQKPIDFGNNIVYKKWRGRSHTVLYNQILLGLKNASEDYLFFCEHDVLYHPSHFDFRPPRDDTYYYNSNVYKYRLSDKKIIGYDCNWLSQLCANRKLLIKHYEKRLEMIANGERAYGWEPGSGQSRKIDKVPMERWWSKLPNIDVRHGDNWTGVYRMSQDEFKNKKNCQNWKEVTVDTIPYWDKDLLLSLCDDFKKTGFRGEFKNINK